MGFTASPTIERRARYTSVLSLPPSYSPSRALRTGPAHRSRTTLPPVSSCPPPSIPPRVSRSESKGAHPSRIAASRWQITTRKRFPYTPAQRRDLCPAGSVTGAHRKAQKWTRAQRGDRERDQRKKPCFPSIDVKKGLDLPGELGLFPLARLLPAPQRTENNRSKGQTVVSAREPHFFACLPGPGSPDPFCGPPLCDPRHPPLVPDDRHEVDASALAAGFDLPTPPTPPHVSRRLSSCRDTI
ncbi:hypothetical protein DB88DRAFT_501930 [Papiliotrema laurentii]|uniref:Uncharacterized protein n=1 Tax=Papiliotrema laurentii TaxID=5418 RepID=A0AAD9CUV5_PAPLA|nr:hypothetical protein DB88DRAFT_501930 [Papiliotrema laurentii]